VKRPLDVQSLLLELIKAKLRYLKEELRVEEADKLDEFLWLLCEGIASILGCNGVMQSLCSENGQLSWLHWGSELGIYDKLSAAMILGATALFHQLLPQLQDQEFVYPIIVAASLGNSVPLNAILDYSLQLPDIMYRITRCCFTCWDAIKKSMSCRRRFVGQNPPSLDVRYIRLS
jgi:hypothetical protein